MLGFGLNEDPVEVGHQLGSVFVGDAPKGNDDVPGSSIYEGAGEADDAFTFGEFSKSCLTGREDCEFCV